MEKKYTVKDCRFFHRWSLWTEWEQLHGGSNFEARERICTNCKKTQVKERERISIQLT